MKKLFLLKWPIYFKWFDFCRFLKQVDISPAVFLPPAFLAFLGALADGISVTILIPTVQGVIDKNFVFIHQKPVLRNIVSLLPGTLSQDNTAIFILLVLLIFLSAVLKNALVYFSYSMMFYQVREFSNKTRKTIYGRYLSFGKTFFDSASLGYLQQVLIGYTQQIAEELKILQDGVFRLFLLIVYVAIAFFISWKLTLFSAIIFPILYYSLRILVKKIESSSKSFAVVYSKMGDKISNALSCMMLIKAYTNEDKEKQNFSVISDQVRDHQFSIDKKQIFFDPFREVLGLCIVLLLIGYAAFLLMYEKSGEIGGFLIFFFVLRRASHYFGVFNFFQSSLAGISGPLAKIEEIFNNKEGFIVPQGTKVLESFERNIEFRDLTFSYKQGGLVFDHLNLSVRKGETIAIIGSSGSGKSTLIYLLMRFYDSLPQSIFIDGVDTREFSLQSLRGKMALVSQDVFLFNDSFKSNLLYGLNREISQTELSHVIKRARLTEVVERIGMDTQLGDRGVKLSGGERQRVSIARAMLKDPEILILDEATSALDSVTENLVRSALDEIISGKTVIVIAHRLTTIHEAQRIIVMEKGRIVQEGSFDQLMLEKEGYLYSYWKNQKLDDET